MPAVAQILPHHQLDQHRWDHCIRSNSNGLIYSTWHYLEKTCDNWLALVYNDYEAVMALPFRQKFGIRYLYHPPFVQQLGLVGSVDADVFRDVTAAARYGDILFNFSNTAIAESSGATAHTNYILDLSEGYEAIQSRYRKDLQLNLRKAEKEQLQITFADVRTACEMYRDHYKSRMPSIGEKEWRHFTELCEDLSAQQACFTRCVRDALGNLLSTGLFLRDEKRIYNVMNTTTPLGRKKEANHLLLDAVIMEFAGQQLYFDFEGSDLPGVKSFYEKFGPRNQPYFICHFNRLPWPLRLLKR